MESILDVLVKIISLCFRKKPIVLTIDAFSDTNILLHSVCRESFVLLTIEPSKLISKFPTDFLVRPGSQFYIYSVSEFNQDNPNKLKIKIKLLNGVKYSYAIKWKNRTPHIK